MFKPTFFDDNDPNNPKRKTYIEREALLLKIDLHGTNKFGMLDEDIREFIKKQPTADVVEVVRCKDCIFSRPVIGTAYLKFCENFDYKMWHEGFCYYGKRKEVKDA